MPSRVLTSLSLTVLLLAAVALAPSAPAAEAATPGRTYGPLPSAADFVVQQYEDFLGRPPDDGGLTYWSDLLEGGIAPSAMVESLARSAEFEGRIAPLVRLYLAFFGRTPDHEGLTYWAGQVRAGVGVEMVAQQFVLSGEFAARYGSVDDATYVDLVYANVLERGADAEGRAYWAGELAGGLSRGRLMVAFADSAEYRRTTESRVLATMLYAGMLRRSPDGEGLDYWSDTIGAGVPYRDAIAGFLGAAEYADRIDRIYTATHPLTGVATRAAADRPALAVKIDNVDAARPQLAIERADVIYEELVEGRLTRFIAVFHSDLPAVVGPVRSVRTTDLDILAQLRTPLLAASGANPGVLAAVDGAQVVNVNAIEAGGAYVRSGARRAPHNLLARTVDLFAAADGRGGRPTALFTYRDRDEASAGAAVDGVRIDFGSTVVGYTATPGGWLRSQNGSAHTTASGHRLAPPNVVVLEVPYGTSPVDARSPEAHTVGTGTARVLTGGRLVTGTWSRSTSEQPIGLFDGGGAPIPLTPGQTIVELAPIGSVTVFGP